MENHQQLSNRKIGSLNNIMLIGSALLIVYILVYFKYYHTDYPLYGIHKYLLPIIICLISLFSLFFLTSSVSLSTTTDKLIVKYFYFFKKQVSIKEIELVKMIKVNAMSDFLGIGYRISNKYGIGIISGDGMALYIELKNKKKITVSVEDDPSIIERVNKLIKV